MHISHEDNIQKFTDLDDRTLVLAIYESKSKED